MHFTNGVIAHVSQSFEPIHSCKWFIRLLDRSNRRKAKQKLYHISYVMQNARNVTVCVCVGYRNVIWMPATLKTEPSKPSAATFLLYDFYSYLPSLFPHSQNESQPFFFIFFIFSFLFFLHSFIQLAALRACLFIAEWHTGNLLSIALHGNSLQPRSNSIRPIKIWRAENANE